MANKPDAESGAAVAGAAPCSAKTRHLYHLTVGNTILKSRWMTDSEAAEKNKDYADWKWPENWRKDC